jgi:SOS response associated peptidase (SRAP)
MLTSLRQRSPDRLHWGLVPYWAKDEKIGFKTINARAETVDTPHSFRSGFKMKILTLLTLVAAACFVARGDQHVSCASVVAADGRNSITEVFGPMWLARGLGLYSRVSDLEVMKLQF